MKTPETNSLIALGSHSWRDREMTIRIINTTTKEVVEETVLKGGTDPLAKFLAASRAFQLLEESIDEYYEYTKVYVDDHDTLTEIRAASCISGLYLDMFNFEAILEHIEESLSFLDKISLKELREKTAIWDKYSFGQLKDFLK